MSRDMYGVPVASQRSPKPGRREMPIVGQGSPSKPYPSAANVGMAPPVTQPRNMSSSRKTASGSATARSSRSNNSSPLTLPSSGVGGGGGHQLMQTTHHHDPVPHSISSSAFNIGGIEYGYDDLSSPVMDNRASSAPGHHRSRSVGRSGGGTLRSYHSTDRDDREFAPIGVPTSASARTLRERSLDRALHSAGGPSYIDDLDPYVSGRGDSLGRMMTTRMSPNPTTAMTVGGGGSGGGRIGVDKDAYIYDLQAQLQEMQKEYSNLKKELEVTNQKLGSSMHSIKTFWSPELKKERALRKEESAKYSLINDQLKLLNSENQKQATLIQQLEEELRMAQMRNPGLDLQQQLEALYSEKEHQAKEIYLLRETIKELELRIESQKQTLQARDESVKKLLEMLQTKGGGKFLDEERLESEHTKTLLFESQARIHHLENMMETKDKDLLRTREELILLQQQYGNLLQGHIESPRASSLQTLVETKDNYTLYLERKVAVLESELSNLYEWQNHLSNSYGVIGNVSLESFKKTETHLRKKVDEMRAEVTKRDQEILAMGAKMRTLEEQHQDYQRHIAVLKESLTAKEEHYNMLQTDVEELRQRLEEKNKMIEKKTQQAIQAQQERNRLSSDLNEIREHMDIKDRKINVLQRKVELQEAHKKLSGTTKEGDGQMVVLQKQIEERQKSLDERQKVLEDMEKRLKKRKEKLDEMENQLQNMEAGHNEALAKQISELRKRNDELEKNRDAAQKDVAKAKQDAIRSQQELDRLLEIMKQSEEEKFAKDKMIKDLQDALGNLKKAKQSERLTGSQLMEEARRREEEAKKDASKAQDLITSKDERIEVLEEALRESVKITADREMFVIDMENDVKNRDIKIAKLEERFKSLQNAHNVRCTNCRPLKSRLESSEAKLTKLVAERRKCLEELFEMKQDALTAAISEKDAHIALLEMSGIKSFRTAEEMEMLKLEKDKLVERIKSENETRVQLLEDLPQLPEDQPSVEVEEDLHKFNDEDEEDDGLQS